MSTLVFAGFDDVALADCLENEYFGRAGPA